MLHTRAFTYRDFHIIHWIPAKLRGQIHQCSSVLPLPGERLTSGIIKPPSALFCTPPQQFLVTRSSEALTAFSTCVRWAVCHTDAHRLQRVFKYLSACVCVCLCPGRKLTAMTGWACKAIRRANVTQKRTLQMFLSPQQTLTTLHNAWTRPWRACRPGTPPIRQEKNAISSCLLQTCRLMFSVQKKFSTFSTYQSKLSLIVVPCFFKSFNPRRCCIRAPVSQTTTNKHVAPTPPPPN